MTFLCCNYLTAKCVSPVGNEVLVVLPSVHLDSHMQTCAAEVIKARHAQDEEYAVHYVCFVTLLKNNTMCLGNLITMTMTP